MSFDDYDELGYPKKKPEKKDFDIKDYPGMSKDSEEEYNKRQAEPLFKKSTDLVPMEQLKEYHENLMCGYHKSHGCRGLTRDKSFYACMFHQAIQAIGTDFFMYYKLITDNDLDRMTPEQTHQLNERRVYMQRWLDNYPQGTTGNDGRK